MAKIHAVLNESLYFGNKSGKNLPLESTRGSSIIKCWNIVSLYGICRQDGPCVCTSMGRALVYYGFSGFSIPDFPPK